jgi:4-hydroxy-tetrahydrodipicolinate reductase
MKPVSVVVLGALGRLGRTIVDEALKESRICLRGGVIHTSPFESPWKEVQLETTIEKIAQPGDVLIDATSLGSVSSNLAWASSHEMAYVLAVTGLNSKIEEELLKASKHIPIVVASNLSVGVTVFQSLSKMAEKKLPFSDISITEIHHKAKKDAPSGTALSMAKTIQSESHPLSSIDIHSIRGGDVVGEHTITYLSMGERIEIRHVATSRAIFGRGALTAAVFIKKQPPGIYCMEDVVNTRGKD